jgi:hypothetical protein
MEVPFFCVTNHVALGNFRVITWHSGQENLADYFTKHHPATHHKNVRPTILTSVNDPEYKKLFALQDFESTQTRVGYDYKSKPTRKMVQTTSFVKTLLKTPKFQNMIAARSA